MSASEVRAVRECDLELWLRLRIALWPDGTESEHRHEIESFFRGPVTEPRAVLMAFGEAGEALGLAELSIRPCAEGCTTSRVAYLEGWYVVPEAPRAGIGRALVSAGEAWGREQGCVEFASDTQPENEASRRSHEAVGFANAGLVLCFRKSISAPSEHTRKSGAERR
jgi:aminoglycoside 6'-N-acetyltransferase I